MTAYGQSITTKWYRDVTPKQLTKWEFIQMLTRALMTVGMVPIRSFSPHQRMASTPAPNWGRLDPELATLDSYPYTDEDWNGGPWIFDYPTSETYNIDGVTYRPCIALNAPEHDASSVQTRVGECVWIMATVRRSDRLIFDDVENMWSRGTDSTTGRHNTNFFGFGTQADSFGSGNYYTNSVGSRVHLWNWKPAPAQGDVNHQTLLSVRNFHVILSKSGLLIQVGTGTGRFDSSDIMNVGMYFGGARVPNRARIPAGDTNLNRIDPVAYIPHQDTYTGSSQVYETGHNITSLSLNGTHPMFWLLNLQHDLLIANNRTVRARAFNIENIERPFYPIYDIDTKTSPRKIDNVGSHVLNRIIYMTFEEYLSSGTLRYIGPLDPSIRIEPTPPWEDVWTFPRWRVADRTAPAGEYVDPSTNINWWLYYVQNMNCMFAVEVEGITKLTAFPTFTAPTQQSIKHYTFANGLGAMPDGVTAVNTTTQGVMAWTATPSTDEVTAQASTTGQICELVITIPLSELNDANNVAYQLVFEARNFAAAGGVTGSSNTLAIAAALNSTTGWLTCQSTLNNAGNNTGDAAYSYAEYTVDMPRERTTGTLKIRFTASFQQSSVARTAAIRNVRLRKLA